MAYWLRSQAQEPYRCWWVAMFAVAGGVCVAVSALVQSELILADIICLGVAVGGRVEVNFFVQLYGRVRVWW